MPEMPRSVLDSFAILALLNDEKGGAEVAELLRSAMGGRRSLHMNEINVGEVFYIVAKHRSPADAERVLDHLRALPLDFVPNAWADVLDAARIKAEHALSYADAFAVSTARRLGASLVTGDPEFRSVECAVEIHWL
ncbi:MAG: PIN domain-containing protein [Longimicrobiales bacterium]